jgi:hypothetical protein
MLGELIGEERGKQTGIRGAAARRFRAQGRGVVPGRRQDVGNRGAKRVSVLGSFNGWDPRVHRLSLGREIGGETSPILQIEFMS